MAEEGGTDELQALKAEIAVLKKTLDGISNAQNTSVSSQSFLNAMKEAEASDAFLSGEGPREPNKYHTNAGGSGPSGGCCVVA